LPGAQKSFQPWVIYTAFFYLHVTGEKLPKRLSFEKGTGKMLMKLSPGLSLESLISFIRTQHKDNSTNIKSTSYLRVCSVDLLRAQFTYTLNLI